MSVQSSQQTSRLSAFTVFKEGRLRYGKREANARSYSLWPFDPISGMALIPLIVQYKKERQETYAKYYKQLNSLTHQISRSHPQQIDL